MRIISIFLEPTNRRSKTHNRFGSLLAATAILGTLICLSTLQGQEDPVYHEWRQRIARTSRILLRKNAENPFAGPVGSGGLTENEGPDRGAPLESLSGLLIPRATPSSATATQEASGESRIQPSTSAYWWIQNPFKAP